MISYLDEDYKETKQVMLGRKTMNPEFRSLAEWIDKSYEVRTINIIYDTMKPGNRPRLQVCLETEEEKQKFTGPNTFNYDPEKQRAIAQKFREIQQEKPKSGGYGLFNFFHSKSKRRLDTENIWIIYGAFKRIAKEEAMARIPRERIAELKSQIGKELIWEIATNFGSATFFLYTENEVKEYSNSAARELWSNQFFDILKDYDEFGYFDRNQFTISLDSKENFDNNYESNWYYYYK